MLKPNTEFYAEWDKETNTYCVFDNEEGKAWSSWGSLKQAEKDVEERTKRHLNAYGFDTKKIYCPNCKNLITPIATEYEEGLEGFENGKLCPICEEYIY